jgi:S-(hydroxymethyl)glutathione dehydrogenase/alcohol dehydrogenase
MKAAVLRGDYPALELVEVATPVPRAGEALVKIRACGVCHTDLHVMKSEVAFPRPAVLGHEISGTIVAFGEGTADHRGLSVGDTVVGAFIMPCTECAFCREGHDDLCENFFGQNRLRGTLYDGESRLSLPDGSFLAMYSMGGLAEYSVVPISALAKLSEGLDPVTSAVLGCAAFTAYGAVHRAGAVREGQSVAVVAVGGVGSGVVQVAAAAGARPVIAIDVADDKLEAALRLGATHAVSSRERDVAAAIREITGGRGVDVAFEALGHPATFSQAVTLLADFGVDRFSQENSLVSPPEMQFEPLDGLPGTSVLTNASGENLNLAGHVVYSFTPGPRFDLRTSAGVQYDTRDLNIATVTARNLLGGQSNIDRAAVIDTRQRRERVEDLGFFLQEELLIDDRLFLTAGIRADQSSANVRDDRLFFYPKAAASYRFESPVAQIDELKFRFAYGESGKQPLFGQKFTPLEGGERIEGILGFQIEGTVAGNLKPERQREFEGGLDAIFANGRAQIEATVFRRQIQDLIGALQVRRPGPRHRAVLGRLSPRDQHGPEDREPRAGHGAPGSGRDRHRPDGLQAQSPACGAGERSPRRSPGRTTALSGRN